MLLSTMIDPTKDVRLQVEVTNTSSNGLPDFDIPRFIERLEFAKINYIYDMATPAERSPYLISIAKRIFPEVLVADHDISAKFAPRLVAKILDRPDADPFLNLAKDAIHPVYDYLLYAYTKIRIELFITSMEEYQAYHKLFVPVERVRFFPEETLLRRMETPSYVPTIAEASAAFQLEPMTSFTVMYAMSSHQVFSTVPLPEFRSMMLPMSYQLWKQEILTPKEVDAGAVSAPKPTTSTLKDLKLK